MKPECLEKPVTWGASERILGHGICWDLHSFFCSHSLMVVDYFAGSGCAFANIIDLRESKRRLKVLRFFSCLKFCEVSVDFAAANFTNDRCGFKSKSLCSNKNKNIYKLVDTELKLYYILFTFSKQSKFPILKYLLVSFVPSVSENKCMNSRTFTESTPWTQHCFIQLDFWELSFFYMIDLEKHASKHSGTIYSLHKFFLFWLCKRLTH